MRQYGAMARALLLSGIAGLLVINDVQAGRENGDGVTIEERARGARNVLVGKIRRSRAEFRRNERGDELIVTRHEVAVSESLKGSRRPGSSAEVLVEGGTVGNLTLAVSDLPALSEGEEVVMFLDDAPEGLKPHRRGLGILRVERPASGGPRVRNTSLTLELIRKKLGVLK